MSTAAIWGIARHFASLSDYGSFVNYQNPTLKGLAVKLAHKIHYMHDRMSEAAQGRISRILASPTHPLGTGLNAKESDLMRTREILAAAIADA